jgi:hypothetical protein
MNKYVIFTLLALTLSLAGCSSDSVSEEESQTQIDGLWLNDSVVIGGQLAEISWSFNNGELVKTLSYSGSSDPIIEVGNYTIGSSIVMSSGVRAHEIDITYYDPDSSEVAITELDAVYATAQELYFGNLRVNESCEGEFYEKNRIHLEVVNGVVVREIELDETVCFSRPDSLNFDRPYQLSEL